MFVVSTNSGILVPHKTFSINLIFNSFKAITIKEFPLYKCDLSDHVSKEVLSSFFITVSARTSYSSFIIYPFPELSFGAMLLGTEATQKITITNTGHLEFEYSVLCKKTLDELQAKLLKKMSVVSKVGKKGKSSKGSKASKSTKAESKASKATKASKASKATKKTKTSKGTKKSKKSKDDGKKPKKVVKIGPPMTCNAFTIKNSKGIIDPQEKAELEIDCSVSEIGQLDETIIVFISETSPKDRLGKPINLKLTGCLPSLKWDDYNNMFNEHYIVNSIFDFIKPKELDQHCVFVKETKCLTFNNVVIHLTASAIIQLFNNSLVDADVNLHLHFHGLPVFKVIPQKLSISSYTKGYFEVKFTPIEIMNYEAFLEISLVMPTGFKSEIKKFILSGEGRVPVITLRQPIRDNDVDNTCNLNYNPTLINNTTMKLISFENTCDFPCKIIIEVFEDAENTFSLHVRSNTFAFLNCPEAQSSPHTKLVRLIPDDVANFDLIFHPKAIKTYTCQVKIHIVNNPFEVYTINVIGDSFSEDIFLEDIPTNTLDIDLISSIHDPDVLDHYCTSYVLNFGNIYVNTLHKYRFKIKNQSTTDMYKFVFRSPIDDIVFIPAIGHLKPENCKDVFVTYVSELPVTHTKLLLDCVITKIYYTSPILIEDDITWDDRQKLIIWDHLELEKEDIEEDLHQVALKGAKELMKNEEINEMEQENSLFDAYPEPEYEIIDDSIRRIPILFSVLVNYSNYESNLGNISFQDTFLFEKRIYNFHVFNPGDVNLEINWRLILQNFTKLATSRNPSGVLDNRPVTAISSQKLALLRNFKTKRPIPLTGFESFFGRQCETESSLRSTSDLTISDFHMPFTISPTNILIAPKQSQQISITFAPLDIFEYKARLKGTIKNLLPTTKEIDFEIFAKSLIPCCHFDVKLSDYITSNRRTQYLKECDECTINATNTKCVEFDCLGVGIEHTKSFNAINPTDEDITYSWFQIKSYNLASVPLFSCHPLNGTICRGKMSSITFTVFPLTTGIFEALYNFKIEKYNLIMQFLIVAHVREADIRFLSANLKLKPAVLGICVTDYIVLKNYENVSLGFKIKKNSLFSEGRKQFIAVDPKKGIVSKKSETKIKISYNPNDVGDEHFTLECVVDFVQEPLTVGISTKCYEVEMIINCILSNGKKMLLTQDADNVVNLGDMIPQHEEMISFSIRNVGKIGFYYEWLYNEDIIERKFQFKFYPKEGYIKVDTEVPAELSIIALRNAILKNYKVELQIRYGPKMKLLINGSVTNTVYKFSFLEFDFGPCIVQNSKICYYHKTLEFFNHGNTALTLECNFLNTSYLTIDFKIRKILPKSKTLINICFHPKKVQKYVADIFFNINTQKVKIPISGEGIELNIAVVNIEDKTISLGSPQVGQLVTKVIKVVNKCAATVKAIFDIWDRLPNIMYPSPPETHYLEAPKKERIIEDEAMAEKPEKGKKEKKGKKDKKAKKKSSKGSKATKSTKGSAKKSTKTAKTGKTKKSKKDSSSKKSKTTNAAPTLIVESEVITETPEEKLRKSLKDMITITPKTSILMVPNKPTEFTINYFPTQKLVLFTEKISVQVLEVVQPLCLIKGVCLGPVFYFDRTEISFGVVVLHCSRTSKLLLINEGDVTSPFKWEIEYKEDFSITPMEGYSMAGLPNTFLIEYHPTKSNIQSKCRITLNLEAYDKPLHVKLIGICADIPESSGILEFTCPVRTIDKKSVTLSNVSNRTWKLYPYIDCEHFTCNDILFVNPKSNAVLDIYYKPTVMTRLNPHKGTIFFKIPEGLAIVYDLIGKALRPDPMTYTTIEMPCKTFRTETFAVYNWSNYKQTFKVYTEDITSGDEVNYYEIKGHDFIEVLGCGTRDYEWHFYGYKECTLEFRVIFMTVDREYMFHSVIVKLTKCLPLNTFCLSTCVRTPVIHKLTLINPLDIPIVYKIASNSHVLSFNNLVTVEPHTEIKEDIEFRPLTCECVVSTLEANCAELGIYLYEFELTSLPPPPEPNIYFLTELGKTAVGHAKIENLSKNKTAFTTKIDNDDAFTVSKTLNLHANQVSQVPVTFCPFNLDKIETTLRIASHTAGEYIYPLIATCIAPKPKGPFIIKPNVGKTIDFINPFLFDCVFKYIIEPNDTFTLNNPLEEFLLSKTATKLNIEIVADFTSDDDVNGKLMIVPKTNIVEKIIWTYYLTVLASQS